MVQSLLILLSNRINAFSIRKLKKRSIILWLNPSKNLIKPQDTYNLSTHLYSNTKSFHTNSKTNSDALKNGSKVTDIEEISFEKNTENKIVNSENVDILNQNSSDVVAICEDDIDWDELARNNEIATNINVNSSVDTTSINRIRNSIKDVKRYDVEDNHSNQNTFKSAKKLKPTQSLNIKAPLVFDTMTDEIFERMLKNQEKYLDTNIIVNDITDGLNHTSSKKSEIIVNTDKNHDDGIVSTHKNDETKNLNVTNDNSTEVISEKSNGKKYLNTDALTDQPHSFGGRLLMDPIGLVKKVIHPAVIRIIRDNNNNYNKNEIHNKDIINNNTYTIEKAMINAYELLKILNSNNHNAFEKSLKHSVHFGHSSPRVEKYRQEFSINCIRLLKSINNEKDLLNFVAVMSIFVPQNKFIWSEYDTILCDKIQDFNAIQVGLLAVHSIAISQKILTFENFNLPVLVYDISSSNLFDFDTKAYFDALKNNINNDNTSNNLQITSFQQVEESYLLEQLSLKFQFIDYYVSKCLNKNITNEDEKVFTLTKYNLKRAFASELFGHALELLSYYHQNKIPISIISLSYLWDYTSRFALATSYPLYQKLYDIIYYSIRADPNQLLNNETIVLSLLESLVHIDFKHFELIHEVMIIVYKYGIKYQNIGLRLFNALVELEQTEYAVITLDNLIKISMNDSNSIHKQISKNTFMDLSIEAKRRLYTSLLASTTINNNDNNNSIINNNNNNSIINNNNNNEAKLNSVVTDNSSIVATNDRSLSDLILALCCFSVLDKNTEFYKLFEKIESNVIPKIKEYSPKNIVALYHCYANIGRFHPLIVQELDNIVLKNMELFEKHEIMTILWACARLNNQSKIAKQYQLKFSKIVLNYYKNIRNHSQFGPSTQHNVARALWSLAVLQIIEYDHIKIANNLFEIFKKKSHKMNLNNNVNHKYNNRSAILDGIPESCIRQMLQAVVEVKLKMKNEHNNRQNQNNNNDNNNNNRQNQNNNINKNNNRYENDYEIIELNRIYKLWLELNDRSAMFLNNPYSSHTHKAVSRLLNQMSIIHENEKKMPNGYIVDIFIPSLQEFYEMENEYDSFVKQKKDHSKGFVLEIDGPFHYESYHL
eukprot:gene7918-10748_t